MQVTGTRGVVKVGPHTAASFVSWSLASVGSGSYDFGGQLTAIDSFWITQHPQDLRLTVGARTWIYRGVLLNVAGNHVSATVSRPEIRG